jgi:hypothetical protein
MFLLLIDFVFNLKSNSSVSLFNDITTAPFFAKLTHLILIIFLDNNLRDSAFKEKALFWCNFQQETVS